MRHTNLARSATQLLSLAFLAIAATASAAPLPLLRITDLDETLQRGVHVMDINNAGQVLSYQSGGPTWLWQPGAEVREITSPGASLVPMALNDAGQFAGWTYGPAENAKPVTWDPVRGLVQVPMGPGLSRAEAHAINIHGQIAGVGTAANHMNHLVVGSTRRGVSDPRPRQRGNSEASAINASGVVGGSATAAGDRAAILVGPRGEVKLLGGLGQPGEQQKSWVSSLNDSGQAVGTSVVGRTEHAFFWSEATGMVNLGLSPNEGDWSRASDINAHGQVVGGYGNVTRSSTFYWDAEHGVVDLNDRLDPTDPLAARTVIIDCCGYARLNDHGQIITYAKIDGLYRAVLLTPVQP